MAWLWRAVGGLLVAASMWATAVPVRAQPVEDPQAEPPAVAEPGAAAEPEEEPLYIPGEEVILAALLLAVVGAVLIAQRAKPVRAADAEGSAAGSVNNDERSASAPAERSEPAASVERGDPAAP